VAFAGPTLSPTAVANDIWLTRFRTTLVAVLGGAVAGIACLAFYTSFEAIRSYAVRSQGIAPEHAWTVPLLVNSFIVVAIGADLWFTTTRSRRALWEQWWPKLLLGAAAGVSFVLNVAYAEPTWAARGVAAIPPAALVLGVELLMMVLRRATMLRAARLQAELEAEQAAAMEAPLSRLQIEAIRRSRPLEGESSRSGAPPRPAVAQARRPAAQRQAPRRSPTPTPPPPAGGIPPLRQRREPPIATSMRAAAAALAGERRPRAGAAAESPHVVAARILDEHGDADMLSPEALVEALASRGVTASLSSARALLRDLRPPLSTRLSQRRPTRPEPAPG